MLLVVEFSALVERYVPYFEDVFSAEALIQFKRYISGLLVSENKTVDGINNLLLVESRNQSSLNRLLTASPFSLEALNEARLCMLQSVAGTRLKKTGVLGVDDTILAHYGQAFEQIAKLYDPVTKSYVWAHDLVTLHYSDDRTDYPLLFQLWQPVNLEKLEQGLRAAEVAIQSKKESLKETAPHKWRAYLIGVWERRQRAHGDVGDLYHSKLTIAQMLIEQWVKSHPGLNLPVAFDSWYTQPCLCRYLAETLHLSYVGALAPDDKVILVDRQKTLAEFVAQLKQEHLLAVQNGSRPIFKQITISYRGAPETYYSYSRVHHIHRFGKQRLVINFRRADLTDDPVFLISNRLMWQAPGITRIYRLRWPVETYHQEGKAEGLDKYQLRDFSAIQRHVAFVAVVYSLLRTAQQDPDLHQQIQRQLHVLVEGGPPCWRRVANAYALWYLALFISAGLAQDRVLQDIMAPLIEAVCKG